ncbi:MAG TPA: hypothetical protein VL172_15125 [Kofleriaceae bacterium]|jgi:hypothetical protein|nr:hypothetical protein [Kofleriaceae bacterium]
MRNTIIPATILLAACGGGGFDAPACDADEVTIRLSNDDGVMEDSQGPISQYGFVNAINGQNGTLDITVGVSATLHLEWQELVANGDSVPARGVVLFGGELDVGTCDFTGTLAVDDDGNGGTFELTGLFAQPPPCTTAVAGTLTGCFRQGP